MTLTTGRASSVAWTVKLASSGVGDALEGTVRVPVFTSGQTLHLQNITELNALQGKHEVAKRISFR